MTGMLEQVVSDGTAPGAAVPGYTVAGKTGTAQIPNPNGPGYLQGAYMATFTGFAPAKDPALSAIVVLDRPTPIFGGAVAAPVFSQVMAYALTAIRDSGSTRPGSSSVADAGAGARASGGKESSEPRQSGLGHQSSFRNPSERSGTGQPDTIGRSAPKNARSP